MSTRAFSIALVLLFAGAGALIWWAWQGVRNPEVATQPIPRNAAAEREIIRGESTPGRADGVGPRTEVDVARAIVTEGVGPVVPADEPRSPLADQLHAKDRTGIEDLKVVLNLFTHYRARYRGYPVGEDNAAMVRALSGQNPGKLAFISRNHPAIDGQGQLLDRWGKPFFFHVVSRDALEIRSAGPDGVMYTPDDQQIATPSMSPRVAGK